MPRPMAVIGITFFFALYLLCKTNTTALILILILAFVGFVVFMSLKRTRKQAALPTACLTVIAACMMFYAEYTFGYEPALELAGDNISVRAVLTDLSYSDDGVNKYLLKTETVNGTKAKVNMLYSTDSELSAEPYDIIEFSGTVYRLGGDNKTMNEYYRSKNIFLGAYSIGEASVIHTGSRSVFKYIIKIKSHIISTVREYLPGDEGGVIIGMLLGNKAYIDGKILSNFSKTGVYHLFAVSGLHVTAWSALVMFVLQKLRLKRRIAALLSIIFVLFFMALTGFSLSCVRAGVMAIVVFLGMIFSKNADSLNSLGLAMLILCIVNPFGASYIGLQLSFLSTCGIIALSPRINGSICRHITTKSKNLQRALRALAALVSVTLSAMIFSIAAIMISFEEVSVIAPVSNLLISFAASVTMLAGGFVPLLSAVPVIARLTAFIAGLFAKYIIFITGVLAKLPFSSLYTGEKYIGLWLACLFFLVAVSVLMIRKNKQIVKLTATLCTVTLIVGIVSFGISNRGMTELTCLNVGDGTAVLLQKGGDAALIGVGGDYYAGKTICDELDRKNIGELRMMLLPRSNVTETSAAYEVLDTVRVGEIEAPVPAEIFDGMKLKSKVVYAKKMTGCLWDGTRIDYCYEKNSCAVHLDIDGTTVLMLFCTGTDVSELPQEWLNADILYCRNNPPMVLECEKYGITVLSGESKNHETALQINKMGGNAYSTSDGNVVIRTTGNSVCSVSSV